MCNLTCHLLLSPFSSLPSSLSPSPVRIHFKYRMFSSLFVMLLLFILTSALVKVDTTKSKYKQTSHTFQSDHHYHYSFLVVNVFFAVTLITIVLMNSKNIITDTSISHSFTLSPSLPLPLKSSVVYFKVVHLVLLVYYHRSTQQLS